MKLKKFEGNPILKPRHGSDWESYAVCNPGVIFDKGKFTMLYRASAETEVYWIYLGLAESKDGFNFKRVSDHPIYTPTQFFEAGDMEDPRIVKMQDGFYYVTYAARAVPYTLFAQGNGPKYHSQNSPRALRENLTRTGLLRTKDFKKYECLGPISRDDVDDRDCVIFPEKIGGKYWMLHRPAEWLGAKYGTDKPGMWITSSDRLTQWKDKSRLLAAPDPAAPWQTLKIGASCPPIKTKHGWLLMYHGVQGAKPERYYRQGVLMLDLKDPRKIISRPRDFVLEPTAPFEKAGVEENVVFAVGNVVAGDTYFCYYGGADMVICAATCSFKELTDFAMSAPIK